MVKYIVTSFSSAESHYAYDYGQEDYLKVTLFQAVELLLFIEAYRDKWMGIKSGGVARQKLGYDASKYPGVAQNWLFTPSYANVLIVCNTVGTR